MSGILYVLPWALWVLAFIGLEANGFRKANDRWPTLSQIVKGWEDHKLMFEASAPGIPLHQRPFPRMVKVIAKKGVAHWTLERWIVAVGIPLLGAFLEAHWVWEWPF